jgi:hypothetical protein
MSKMKETTHLTLTRYLYIKDEVMYSLLLSLLDKKDINCVLFWTYELYYSGYEEELFHYIRRIYFDFYALLHPKFYTFIDKQILSWYNTKDDIIVGHIMKNLFILRYSYTVFSLRQFVLLGSKCSKTFKGRKPKWLLSYKEIYHPLLRCIQTKSYTNIYYYILQLQGNDLKYCLHNVGKYFNKEEGKHVPSKFYEEFDTSYENMTYSDVAHVWFTTILHLMEYETVDKKNKKMLHIKMTKKEIDLFMKTENDACSPRYKTLEFKRLYAIHDMVPYFKTKRESFPVTNDDYNFIDEIQHHWLYYASNCPIYAEIMNTYEGIIMNDEKRCIEFKDDDDFEDFYENYGYFEPDEQSTETIQKVFQYNSKNIDINSFINDSILTISFDLSSRFIY